jgi:hypothetical protein
VEQTNASIESQHQANKLNVQKHLIKVFNPHFVNFAMSTLPTWTIQSRHNGGR